MKNEEVAKIFYEMADILEMQGVNWKPAAYRKAARAIESISEDLEELHKRNKLEEIPGVGKALAEKIEEYLKTGKIKKYEELKKTVPKGITKLMELQGLGPKKVKALYKNLGIKSVKELEKAAKQHKISKLPTFKEKTEENILKSLEMQKTGEERNLLHFIMPLAEHITNSLKNLKEVDEAVPAGSLRRRKETVRDLDILVTSKKPEIVMEYFTKMQIVKRILGKGETKSTVITKEGIQIDVRVVEPKQFGSALLYFTGSKDHNIHLRGIAIKKGYKLSEYGLFLKKTGRRIAGETEEEVYKKLGMKYIEPELREDTGEIEASMNNKTPNLIKQNEIRGDLHVHSTYSDGTNSITEIAKECKKLGYQYVNISDHSKSQRITNGLKEEDIDKKIREIEKVNKEIKGIKILCGTEVEILADGSLDYDNETLKRFDIVIGSVHSNFKMEREKTTERLITALENPNLHILGHPTGRILNRREGYDFDFDKIVESAKKEKKIFEINAMPERMDLSSNMTKSAVENKVRLAINTDAHNINHLIFMKEGVYLARRGWCEKKDIVNTYEIAKLMKLIGKEK